MHYSSVVIRYFSHIRDWHRVFLLTGMITLFWILENRQHWRLTVTRWPHALTNATFVLTGAVVQMMFGYWLLRELNWTSHHHWGLLTHLPFTGHPVIYCLLAFLLLDFLEYVYHILMHRYGTLWRFHAVHHADPLMDVSTVLREHPGETFIRLAFLLGWVFISGVTFWALMFRQFIQIIANVAAHAHYRLPDWLDRMLGWLLVTPNSHHVHHHYRQPFTDSNYGDVLSIWDRLFGTFRRLNAEEVIFGLDSLPESRTSVSFWHLLAQPFRMPTGVAQTDPARVSTE